MIKINDNAYIVKNQNQYKQAVKDYLGRVEYIDWNNHVFKEEFEYYFPCVNDNYPKYYPCNVMFTSNYDRGRWKYFLTTRDVSDLRNQIKLIQDMIDTMENL